VLFELYADNKHPTQNTTSVADFWGLQNPQPEIQKFSQAYALTHRFMYVISQKVEIGAG